MSVLRKFYRIYKDKVADSFSVHLSLSGVTSLEWKFAYSCGNQTKKLERGTIQKQKHIRGKHSETSKVINSKWNVSLVGDELVRLNRRVNSLWVGSFTSIAVIWWKVEKDGKNVEARFKSNDKISVVYRRYRIVYRWKPYFCIFVRLSFILWIVEVSSLDVREEETFSEKN